MFGLSGSPFGLTGTLGAPGGPQFGLTVGPGTLSPSFSAGHVTGNPQVDTALNAALSAGGKQGLAALGLPSSVTASFLSALTHAPQLVGFIGGLISAMGTPFSLVSLAHSIASLSPTSVASLQAALADPNPESQVSLAQALGIMSGAQMGPTYGGPQAPSPTRGYSQQLSNAREDIGPPTADPNESAAANAATAAAVTEGVSTGTSSGGVASGGTSTGEGGTAGAPSAGDTGGSPDAS